MKSLFENITDDEYKTLDEILHNSDSTPATFFFNDPTIDGRIHELEKYNLITVKNGKLSITELGRSALVEHDKIVKSRYKKLAWEIVRFIIPTMISIIALVISILK